MTPRCARALAHRWRLLRADPARGGAAVELTLLTPVFLLSLLLVVGLGRVVDARIQIDDAAHAAARAASLAATPAAASQTATATATEALAGAGVTCSPINVTANVGNLAPGSSATVTISCTIALANISGLGVMPGHETLTSSFSSVIDTYRSTPTEP